MYYRFAITDDGTIEAFDPDFQKEAFRTYIKVHGLTEENAMDAGQDWEAVQEGLSEEELADEQPNPLPDTYIGNVYDELKKIYRDLCNLGLYDFDKMEFMDIVGLDFPLISGDDEEEEKFITADILKSIGYELETVSEDGKTLYVIR